MRWGLINRRRGQEVDEVARAGIVRSSDARRLSDDVVLPEHHREVARVARPAGAPQVGAVDDVNRVPARLAPAGEAAAVGEIQARADLAGRAAIEVPRRGGEAFEVHAEHLRTGCGAERKANAGDEKARGY